MPTCPAPLPGAPLRVQLVCLAEHCCIHHRGHQAAAHVQAVHVLGMIDLIAAFKLSVLEGEQEGILQQQGFRQWRQKLKFI